MGVTTKPLGIAFAQMLACLAGGDKYLPDPVSRLASHLCGCGAPEVAFDWIADWLNVCIRLDWTDPGDVGAEWVARYFLDDLGFTDHDTSVRCAHPTQDGMILFGFLCRWGVDWEDKGPWVDAEGVSWGMR